MIIPGLVFYEPITDDIIPGIRPYYSISSDGKIYTSSKKAGGREVPLSQSTDDWGYKQVHLMTENGRRSLTVHRLIAKTFIPIDNPDDFQVNHINGDKANNNIYNLEWVTPGENLQHAYDTGLRDIRVGEDLYNSSINNEQARFICEKLSEGMLFNNIVEELESLPYPIPDGILNIIGKIYRKESWNWISNEYNFDKEIINKNIRITDKEVHKICQLLSEGFTDTNEILLKCGFDIYNMDKKEYDNLRSCYYSIKSRKKRTKISNQYDF